jgi:hypothetical protein
LLLASPLRDAAIFENRRRLIDHGFDRSGRPRRGIERLRIGGGRKHRDTEDQRQHRKKSGYEDAAIVKKAKNHQIENYRILRG